MNLVMQFNERQVAEETQRFSRRLVLDYSRRMTQSCSLFGIVVHVIASNVTCITLRFSQRELHCLNLVVTVSSDVYCHVCNIDDEATSYE